MRGKTYRILSPTIALTSIGEKCVPVTIPQGAIVTVRYGPLGSGGLVDLLWDHKVVTMFLTDLRERATAVQ